MDLSLPSYPKTSGATGLHILVPLRARYGYDDVRTFARLLAVRVDHPASHAIGVPGGFVSVKACPWTKVQ